MVIARFLKTFFIFDHFVNSCLLIDEVLFENIRSCQKMLHNLMSKGCRCQIQERNVSFYFHANVLKNSLINIVKNGCAISSSFRFRSIDSPKKVVVESFILCTYFKGSTIFFLSQSIKMVCLFSHSSLVSFHERKTNESVDRRSNFY